MDVALLHALLFGLGCTLHLLQSIIGAVRLGALTSIELMKLIRELWVISASVCMASWFKPTIWPKCQPTGWEDPKYRQPKKESSFKWSVSNTLNIVWRWEELAWALDLSMNISLSSYSRNCSTYRGSIRSPSTQMELIFRWNVCWKEDSNPKQIMLV